MGILTCVTALNLTKIDFSNNHIQFDEQRINELSVFLSHFTLLEHLNLANNNLQTAGAITLFKNLACIALRVINISGNFIGKRAANHIIVSLSKSNKLQEIDLSSNTLKTHGIKKILTSTNISNLTKFNISNNSISGGILINNILTHAVNLVELNFSCNKTHLANISQCCSHLVKLNMCNNEFTDEEAAGLAQILSANSKLQELDLSHNNLKGTGIKIIFGKLNNISHLTKFNASYNVIGEQAAYTIGSFLSKNTNLKELDISFNNLNESGTKILCKRITILSKLTNLKLNGNNFTHLAADDIAEVLLHNTELEEIDISDNSLLAAGAVTMFNGMKNIFTLRSANISHNCITNEAVDSIAGVLSQNSHLRKFYLAGNVLGANGIIALCKAMSNISYLTHLDMSSNEITDEAADDIATFLSHNPELKELDLSNNLMKTPGATILCKAISMLHGLNKLNISNNRMTGEAAFDIALALAKNKALEDLSINYSLEECGAMQIIIRMIKFVGLMKLNVGTTAMELTHLTIESIAAHLNDNIRIKELDLSYNNLDATDFSIVLGKLEVSHLTKFNISNNAIGELAADDIGYFLSKNTNLKELDVSCNNLYESGIKTLCKRITNISNLTKLKLGGNDFTHLAADDVAEVLLHNTKLKEIDISDNSLLATGAVSIFHGMKNIFTLRSMNASHNWITYEAADDIAAALSHNTHLRELYLAGNFLEAIGVTALCRGVKISHLTHLDMSCNKITDEAADEIAAFLSRNPKIKELDLSDNLIQSTGAKIIFTELTVNLNKMNISKNAITDKAAIAIADFLLLSRQLKEVDLSYNCLQAAGAVMIFRVLSKCSSLSKLSMNNNMINDDAADDIIAHLLTTLKEIKINLKDNKMSLFTIHYIQKHYPSEVTSLIL